MCSASRVIGKRKVRNKQTKGDTTTSLLERPQPGPLTSPIPAGCTGCGPLGGQSGSSSEPAPHYVSLSLCAMHFRKDGEDFPHTNLREMFKAASLATANLSGKRDALRQLTGT